MKRFHVNVSVEDLPEATAKIEAPAAKLTSACCS